MGNSKELTIEAGATADNLEISDAIYPFHKPDIGGEIEILFINNEPWFVGKSVAESLGYKDTGDAIKRHVDAEDKLTRCFTVSGQGRNMYIINESGLYSLILSSKLPTAKQFKKWVTSEVLPTIRKTGGYVNNDDLFVNTYLPFADDSVKMLFKQTLAVINEQNKKIKVMTPKAEYFDALVDRNLLTNIRDTATELGIKERDFTKLLIEKKYCYRNSSNQLRPYSEYKDTDNGSGLFHLKDVKSNNSSFVGHQMLITPKGKATLKLMIDMYAKKEEA